MSEAKSKLKGAVQTVLGPISPEKMGITTSHEHILIDLTVLFNPPKDEAAKKFAAEPVSINNAGYIRYHLYDNLDDVVNVDEKAVINELQPFKRAGGNTVVDLTMNADLGRNPLALKRISKATGLNILMGSGYYIKAAHNPEVMSRLTEDDIAEDIIKNITEGVERTGIRSGVIGELGCSWPIEESFEKKALRGAGIAQRETGAPLMIHTGRNEDAPAAVIKIFKEVGADLSHVCICHMERTMFDPKKRYQLVEAGCYIEYDAWGNEGYWPDCLDKVDLINDIQRIAQVKDLIARGFGNQLLVGHDIVHKCWHKSYGGFGYAHILENVIPVMRSRGMKEEHINSLIIENPKRFFAFR